MVPTRRKPGRRALLDGNFARRKLPLRETEYCIWDTELAGFGLRIRPTGKYYWFVRLRHRGKHRRITLGRSDELAAELARAQARRLLAEAALDGLPKRAVVKATPILSDFVDTYWDDLSRVWKASTARRKLNAWKTVIAPAFGTMRVADILPADVHRLRDDCAGRREGLFNRALPVLASLLKYAEALRLRRKGSNPCRSMPRYKREPKERYLTPAEYRRIGAALREQEETYPAQVAIVRPLLFTGARVGEILNLRWEWVQPPVAASNAAGTWQIDSATLSAARRLGTRGNIAVDLDWEAGSGRIGGGVTFAQQLGQFGLSASAVREGAGWRAGIGVTLGLYRGADRWRTAPAGAARSGAVMAEMLIDADGDGLRGPDEDAVAGGRFIVGAALRREETDAGGRVLIGGIAPGPSVEVETQLSSLTDFTLRPVRAGDRLTLRPGEVRHLPVPLRPTASIEVQVLLVAGDTRTPRAGVPVILRDAEGREAAQARTDFDGFVLFEGLPFGAYQAEAAGQRSATLAVSREAPEASGRVLIAGARSGSE
jgi:hypothetical protein